MFKKLFSNKTLLLSLTVIIAAIFCDAAMATSSGVTLSSMQQNISKAVGITSTVLMDIATVAGIGFIFAAFFKFHQHKQNPTQVPLSQGITLLLIGAALAVFPMLISTTSKGVFGTGISKAGTTQIKSLVSSTGG